MRGLFSAIAVLLLACTVPAQTKSHLHFTVTLARNITDTGVSGRLLIFMTRERDTPLLPRWDNAPGDLWIAAKEITYLGPGDSVDVDVDDLAFPRGFSSAPAGVYRVRAVLDTNHSYAYTQNEDNGDLRSEVSIARLPAATVAIALDQLVQNASSPVTHAESIDFESRLLSEFWGRAMHIRGFVVLPPSYGSDQSQTYPAVYWTHGFGGTLEGIAKYELQYYYPYMERGERPEMIYVLLDQSCPFGTHEFANSSNNGPWGDALVKELIPALERKYRMDATPNGRLLQGHSSGGWAALWLQVSYPDVFGGAWPTAPDPADFHAFIPVDLTTARNIYRKLDGTRTIIMRHQGREIAMEDYARREAVLGEYGGQLSSFEAVFSPRAADGRPMRLFNRATGEIDPEVAKAWGRYDVARLVRANGLELRSKLNGKIHVYVGTADDFYLDRPARLLERALEELGVMARFVYLPGRTHENVYENGTAEQIWQEMWRTARPHATQSQR